MQNHNNLSTYPWNLPCTVCWIWWVLLLALLLLQPAGSQMCSTQRWWCHFLRTGHLQNQESLCRLLIEKNVRPYIKCSKPKQKQNTLKYHSLYGILTSDYGYNWNLTSCKKCKTFKFVRNYLAVTVTWCELQKNCENPIRFSKRFRWQSVIFCRLTYSKDFWNFARILILTDSTAIMDSP